jgi:hypothetical protein
MSEDNNGGNVANVDNGGGGGKTLSQYLGNPYVLMGIALVVYWYFSRKKLIYENPNLSPSIKFLDGDKSNFVNSAENKAKKHKVPLQLVKDCEKMNEKEIAKIIIDNQNMINKTKMSNDERNEMIKMVNFLESELDTKMD